MVAVQVHGVISPLWFSSVMRTTSPSATGAQHHSPGDAPQVAHGESGSKSRNRPVSLLIVAAWLGAGTHAQGELLARRLGQFPTLSCAAILGGVDSG